MHEAMTTARPVRRLAWLFLLHACLWGLFVSIASAQPLDDPDDTDDWDEKAKPAPKDKAKPGKGGETLDDPEDTDDWGSKETGPASQPATSTGTGIGPVEVPVKWGWNSILRVAVDPSVKKEHADGISEDTFAMRGFASASLQYKPRKGIRLQLNGQLIYRLITRHSPEDSAHFGHLSRNNLEARLKDTFVELTTTWIDLTVGMATTVWGANTLVNPNDALTARDLRDGPALDPDALRISSPTLKTEAYIGNVTLSLVWLPGFLPNQVDMFGSDYAFLGPGSPGSLGKLGTILEALVNNSVEGQIQQSLLYSQMPRVINGSILGTRVALSVAGWDLAAQYCYTMTRTPVYRLRQEFVAAIQPLLQRPYLELGEQQIRTFEELLMLSDHRPLESSFRRYHQLGLSVTKPIWKLVASLDLSYVHRQPLLLGGAMPLLNEPGGWFSTSIFSSTVYSTLGMQYTYGDSVQITVEGWHELQLDILDMCTPGNCGPGEPQRPALLLGGPNRGGLALLARYEWRRTDLTFELAGQLELHHLGYWLMPQVSYRVGDHLRIFAGVSFFGGNTGSTGRLLDPNDQIYTGIQAYL